MEFLLQKCSDYSYKCRIGGLLGTMLTGILADPSINSAGKGLCYGNPHQLTIQAITTGTTIVYSAVATLIIKVITGIRKINFVSKVKLEIAVDDKYVNSTVNEIANAARTGVQGKIGDGEIFILLLMIA